MKLLRNILLTVVLLFIAAVALISWRAANARDADAQFHSGLTRTLAMRSDSVTAGGTIPAQFTCTGPGGMPPSGMPPGGMPPSGSPQISWSDAPPQTASFVLIAIDWDVPSPAFRLLGFTHWTLYDIPSTLQQLDAGISVKDLSGKGATSGMNSGGTVGYTPPCPPMGIHKYIFRVYALDVPQLQPASPDHDAIIAAMKGHVLGYGELSAFYSK
jgi:Raf kinase inhibitor-like YbhB/YbcL family protein